MADPTCSAPSSPFMVTESKDNASTKYGITEGATVCIDASSGIEISFPVRNVWGDRSGERSTHGTRVYYTGFLDDEDMFVCFLNGVAPMRTLTCGILTDPKGVGPVQETGSWTAQEG